MRLPSGREPRGDDAGAGDFERWRRSLHADLERWPQVLDEIEESLRDVLPASDVEETDDAYLFDIELPGVSPEDVEVAVTPGRLVVTGERRRRERVGLFRHRNRSTGRFRLEATLPAEVDRNGVTARLDHGLLHVVLPKAAASRRRRIQVTRRTGDR